LPELLLIFAKNDHNIGFREKNAIFFAENWQKSQNIAIIKSTPGLAQLESIRKKYLAGANPATSSYNASVVNFYIASGSLARLEKNYILLA
jgi:hypothetical protein